MWWNREGVQLEPVRNESLIHTQEWRKIIPIGYQFSLTQKTQILDRLKTVLRADAEQRLSNAPSSTVCYLLFLIGFLETLLITLGGGEWQKNPRRMVKESRQNGQWRQNGKSDTIERDKFREEKGNAGGYNHMEQREKAILIGILNGARSIQMNIAQDRKKRKRFPHLWLLCVFFFWTAGTSRCSNLR